MVGVVSGNSLGLSLTSWATLGRQGGWGGGTAGRSGEQAYVNVATGNLVLQRQDDFLASLGQGLNVVRTYNSAGQLNDDNGDNWSVGIYNQPLQLTGTVNAAGSTIRRTGSDGAASVYAYDTVRLLYVSADGAGAHDTIAWDSANSQYVWSEGSSGMQERYEGNADARLVSRTDANGNTTSFSYGAGGLLQSVTTASGETTYYDYTGNQLQQVRVVAQGSITTTRVHYGYDASGRLSAVTVDLSPQDNSIATGGTYQTSYTYDGASNRIASVTQTDGTRLDITYVLVGSEYRVATIGDAANQVTTYSYDTVDRRTTVTDPLGVSSRYSYDAQGQLIQVQTGITAAKPLGLSQLYYAYDASGNVTAITDGLGQTITMQYDANGNQTLRTDPVGNTVVSTYDGRNQLATETVSGATGGAGASAQSSTTRLVYDAAGKNRLRFSLSAEGRVTEHRYDSFGQRLSSIDYAGTYDLSGLASTATPTEAQLGTWASAQNLSQGQRTDYTYDFRGQLATRTVYNSLDAAGSGSGGAVTTFVYSQAGELLQTIQPLGGTTVYVYDGLGRVIATTAPSSDGVTPNVTSTTYQDALAQTTVTLANGLSTVSVYDAAGRLVSVMQSSAGSGLGTTTYTYDQANRLVMTQDPTGVRRHIVYDAAGRKVADVDGTGAVTEYIYNANNQLTQTIFYAQKVGTTSAPTMAQVHALAHADDRRAWRVYDGAQRLVWQVDALGYVTQTDYDSAGRIVQVTSLATPINTALLGDATRFVVVGGALTPAGVPDEAASAITVQVSQASSTLGSSLTLTAMVIGNSPQGQVSFYNGATLLGTVNLAGGMASLVVNNLPAGANSIRAQYAGNASNAASTSSVVVATVQNMATVVVSGPAQPVAQGETVVLSATVSGATPGGTVTFFDGAVALGSGTVQIVGGVAKAVLHTASLGLGNHAIIAVYSGDTLNTGATSGVSANVQIAGASAVALASNLAQALVGNTLNLTATVNTPSGQPQATGTVSFYNGNTLLGTAVLSNGVAVYSTSALAAGLHSLRAVYEGDAGTAASTSATLGQVVLPLGATTVVLTPSNVQVASGSSVTLNAMVAAVVAGGPALTGTVSFYDGVTLLGTVNVSGGAASLVVNGVATGGHAYRAVYSGDSADAASTSASVAVAAVVGGPSVGTPGAMTSAVTVGASSGSIGFGNSVTLTATVQGASASGTVTFVSAGTVLGTANVVAGVATLVVSSLAIGNHQVHASYSGDGANPSGISVTAIAVSVAPPPTLFSVGSSLSTAVKNTPVVLTAQLAGTNPALPPTGSASFYSGATLLGTANLVNGIAALSVGTLAAGTHNITVQYAGDANNAAGVSNVMVQTITPAPAAISLAASSNSIQAGGSVTLTANLGTTVTGTVTFFNGFTSLGTASIVNGVASLVTTLAAAGTANITAVYSGDTANASSASAVAVVNVTGGAGSTSVVVVPVVPAGGVVAGTPTLLTAEVGSNVAMANVSVVGGVYTKTSAYQTWNDSSIRSVQGLTGGASVSFVAQQTNKYLMMGLNSDPTTDNSYVSLDWAFQLGLSGALSAYKDGSSLGVIGTYAVGDVLSIDYNGTHVRYMKNGVVLHQVAATIAQPLYLDSSFYDAGAQISNLQFKNAAGVSQPLTPATGTVTFFSGQASLGTVNIVNGVASLMTSALEAGTASIQAVYSGDAVHAAAVSSSVAVAVGSKVQLTASSASVAANAPLTLVADVGYPAQVSTALTITADGGVSGGAASVWNPMVGTTGYTGGASVSFRPGATPSGRGVAIGLTTDPGASSGNYASIDYALVFENNTAYVYNNGTLVHTRGGYVGDVNEFSVTYESGNMRYRLNGVVFYQQAASVVQPLYLDGRMLGQQSTLQGLQLKNATGQKALLNTAATAGGSVAFYNGQTLLGTAALVNGKAQLVSSALSAGGASITAVYSGDASNAGAVSAAMNVSVTDGVALSASSTSITAGAPVVLTANVGTPKPLQSQIGQFVLSGVTVAGSTVTKPTGVQAYDSSIRSTAGYTAGACASFTVTQTTGIVIVGLNTDPATDHAFTSIDHSIFLNDGNAYYSNGTSTPFVTPVVVGDALSIEYTGSAIRILKNGVVVFQQAATIAAPLYLDSSFCTIGAQVGNLRFSGGAADNTVSFFSGSTLLGKASVVNGSAVLNTSALAVNGTANITAIYSGDYINPAATSSAMPIVVSGAAGGLPATTTTLTASPASISRDASTLLTAVVGGGAGGVMPTGSVMFYAGSAYLGASVLVDGQATFIAVGLAVGASNLRAVYTGDAQAAGSASEIFVETVTKTVSSAVVSTSVSSRTASVANVALTTRLAGTNPTGTVTFYNNGAVVGSVVNVINGVASLNAVLPVGSSNITAQYSGDANNLAATSAGVALSTRAPSTLSVAAPSPASVAYGAEVTLSATAHYSAASAGTVAFYSGGILLGVAAVQSNGIATLVTRSIPVGTAPVTAAYSGNAEHDPISQASAQSLTVTGLSTETNLAVSHNQTPYGTTVFLKATVTANGWAAGIGGTVTFYNGTTALGMVAAVNGVASFSVTGLDVGVNLITAVYNGSAGYGPSMSGVGGAGVTTVPANVTLSSSAASVAQGSPVTLAAQVTGANPGGIVTFTQGATILGTAPVIGGVATLVVSNLPAGGHALLASYGGDTHNGVAISAALLQMVTLPPSGSLSRTSLDPIAQVGNIVLNVAGVSPVGTVTLLNGSTVVGAATVTSGVATFSARQLPAGTSNLTAIYSGDAVNGSTQLQFDQTVTASLAATSVTMTATQALAADGYGIKLLARVNGQAPGGSITFYRNGIAVGSVALTYGMASIELVTPVVGGDTFHAVYGGDASNEGSSSTPLAPSTAAAILNASASTQDRTTHQVYDQDGLLRAAVDGEGYLVEYQYNATGQLVKTIRYYQPLSGFTGSASIAARLAAAHQTGVLDGLRPAADARDAHTVCFYDARGLKAGELDAEGYLTQFAHDGNGNLVQTARYSARINAVTPQTATAATRLADLLPGSPAVGDRTTTLTYDSQSRLAQQVDFQGTVSQYSYDSSGNMVKTVQAAGTAEVRNLYTRYDVQGRVIAELSAQGGALISPGLSQPQLDAIWADYAVKHTYDMAGRRTSTTDQNGNKTLFFYDEASRLTHTINGLGEVTERRYNPHGEVSAEVRYGTRIALTGLVGGLTSNGGSGGAVMLAALTAVKDIAKDNTQTYTYSTRGGLASVADALGNITTFAYNAFGEEASRTQPTMGVQAMTKASGYDRRGLQIASTLDAGGINVVTSTIHDAFGRVISRQDANGNTRTQTYDRLGRMVTLTDPQTPARTSSYDAFGRVLAQTDALGKTTTYVYDDAARSVVVITPESITVTTVQTRLGQTLSVTNGVGTTTSYTYDKNGNLVGTITPLTGTSSAYDRAGRLVETTDANGTKVELTYDAANRVLSRTIDPLGLAIRTEYTYDAKGQQISTKDPNGTTTQMVFDLKGQLKQQIVDPLGLNLVTAYDYDKRGNSISVTDPNGTVTTYTYDKLGRRTQEALDPTGLNLRKSYDYDKNGNVTRSLDGNGQATRYIYDANDRLVFKLDAMGAVEETTYDAEGHVVVTRRYGRQIDTSGLGNVLTDSDIRSRLLPATSQSPDAIQNFYYDGDGRVKATLDGVGALVTYKRDGLGNVLEQTAYIDKIVGWVGPGSLPTPAWGADFARTYTVYDQLGRARYSVDGTGAVSSQRYDGNGNVIERVTHVNRLSLAIQPLSAHPTESELASRIPFLANDVQDGYSRFAYDRANRLVLQADGVGAVTQHRHDANGNLLQSVKHAMPISVGQLHQATVPPPVGSADDRVTRQVYDKANRVVLAVDAAGSAIRYDHDRNGNIVKRTQFASALGSYYLGQAASAGTALISVYQPSPGASDRVIRSVYDAANRHAFGIDAEGGVTELRHDGVGNLIYSRQYKTAMTGGQLGQIDSIVAASGRATPGDMAARLTASLAEDRITRQYFDAAGNLRFARDANLNLKEFRYDGVGRLSSTTTYLPAQTGDSDAETYGSAGTLAPLPVANGSGLTGQTESFDYDAQGRIESSTDAAGSTETFLYDALGRKMRFTNKLGTQWDYEYDAAGRLTRETGPLVAVTVQGSLATQSVRLMTDMAYDGRGNLVSRTEAAERAEARTTQYAYDALGRQVRTTYAPVGVYNATADTLASNGTNGLASRVETTQELYTETVYNALGDAVSGRDTAGNWSYKTYDATGRVLHEVDALRQVTGYARNIWGEVEKLTRYAVALSPLPPSLLNLTAAQVQGAVNSFNHTGDRELTTTYDRQGRVLTVIESPVYMYDAQVQGYAWNPAQPGVLNVHGKRTQNTYNAFGDLTTVAEQRQPNVWTTMFSYYYDPTGRQTHIVDAMGYLTTQTFDAAGRVTSRIEFANASTFNAGTGRPVAAPSAKDRAVEYTYDSLGRKTQEKRLNIQASSAASPAGQSTVDAVTQYAYDALGNLTTTIDANGGVTRSYYDSLGRVIAVVAPVRDVFNPASGTYNSAAPVTEMRHDAFGGVVAAIQRANGSPAPGSDTFSAPLACAEDRVTRTYYDGLGRAVETNDAAGHTRYNSYDAKGHLAKTWEAVTVANGGTQTLFKAYEYDAVGNLALQKEPWEGSATGLSVLKSVYNAFGEMTARYNWTLEQEAQAGAVQSGAGREYYDYDSAGRVWRTNAGDGVAKIRFYNALGMVSCEITSATVDLKAYATPADFIAHIAMSPGLFRRTDKVYDALGRLTDTVAPERAFDPQQDITINQNSITASIWTGQIPGSWEKCRVNLTLPPMNHLGAGDFKIVLNYKSVAYNPNPEPGTGGGGDVGDNAPDKAFFFEAQQLRSGFCTLEWDSNPTGSFSGISLIEGATVFKKDLFGNWQQVAAGQAAVPGQNVTMKANTTIDIGFPADLFSATKLFIRTYVPEQGAEAGWVAVPPVQQTGFGEAHRFDIESFVAQGGTYEYRALSTPFGEPDKLIGSARFTVGTPSAQTDLPNLPPITANLQVTEDIVDGNLHTVLRWPAPPPGTTVSIQRRVLGTTTWLSPPQVIFISADGRTEMPAGTQEVAIDIDGVGSYQYELVFNYPGSGGMGPYTAHAVGTYQITAPTAATSSTTLPDFIGRIDGVMTSLTKIDGAIYTVIRWPQPAQAGTAVSFRYRLAGSSGAWTTRTPGNGIWTAGITNTELPAGLQGTPLNVAAGTYEFELMFTNVATGAQARSGGNFTLPTPNAFDGTAAPTAPLGDFINQGITGYIYDSPAPGRVALHRWFNPSTYRHFYLRRDDPEARAWLQAAGFQYEWAEGYVYNTPQPGTLPLYRLNIVPTDKHIYTTSDTERAQLIAQGWTPEGDEGYVSAAPEAGTRALYHMYRPQFEDNFYTSTFEHRNILLNLGTTPVTNPIPLLGDPGGPTVTAGVAIIDGQPFNVLQWPMQEPGTRVTVIRTNASGVQTVRNVFTSGDSHGTQLTNHIGQCVVIDGEVGFSTYQIIVEYPITTWHGALEARSTMRVTVPPSGSQLPSAEYVATVRTGADRIDGSYHDVLLWNIPAPGTTVTVRMRPQGATTWLPNLAIYTGIYGNSSPRPGYHEAPIDIYGPGNYEYEIVFTKAGAPTKTATGQVTIYTDNYWTHQKTTPPYFGGYVAPYYTDVAESTRPVVHLQLDRWGNVLEINETRRLWNAAQSAHNTYEYNANNQLIKQTLAEDQMPGYSATETYFYYDKLGQLLATRDAKGYVNSRVYDAGGSLIGENAADGGQTGHAYEIFGDKVRTSVKFAEGNWSTTDYTYDRMSRLTQTSLAGSGVDISSAVVANGSGVLGTTGAIADNVDSHNGVIMYATQSRLLQRTTYDEAGRKVKVTTPGTVDSGLNIVNEHTLYEYDRRGNLAWTGRSSDTAPAPALWTLFTYDAMGRKVSETNALLHTKRWTQDYFGRMGESKDFRIDAAGVAAAVATTYTYDKAGQLTSQTGAGQSLSFQYDGAGQLIQVNDQSTGTPTVSTYTYDKGGRKLSEKVTRNGVTYQSNHMVYDAQGRLRMAAGDGAIVWIVYDPNGNRQTVETTIRNTYVNAQGQTLETAQPTTTVTYGYDAMNRQTYSQAVKAGVAAETIQYTYDKAGHRKTESVTAAGVNTSRSYTYDQLGRVREAWKSTNGAASNLEQTYQYDGAGRSVRTRSIVGDDAAQVQYKYDTYDSQTGLAQMSHTYVRMGADGLGTWRRLEDVFYGDSGVKPSTAMAASLGYDAAGNLKGIRREQLNSSGDDDYADRLVTFTTHRYNHNGAYQVVSSHSAEVRTGDAIEWSNPLVHSPKQSTVNTQYDANGGVQQVDHLQANAFDRVFVNDWQGRALYVKQGTLSAEGTGQAQKQLIVDGEVLARYGVTTQTPAQNGATPVYSELSDVYIGATPVGGTAGAAPSRYVVVEGETLQSIARTTMGDSRLWYLIAEANGLADSAALQWGQALIIPSRALSTNAADTFRPYDPSQAVGDLSPALPAPGKGGGCGGLGKVIMVVVAIVVAAATQQWYLANYASGIGYAGAVLEGSTLTLASTAAATTTDLVVAGALGGAAGSVASQLTGMALGVQDKFSWKGVALGAISGGVSAGMGGIGGQGGIDLLGQGSAATLGNRIVQAALGNALTQGVAVATGLQDKFDWRSVAASAAGAGVGQAVGGTFQDVFVDFGSRLATGLVAGTAVALMRGGKVAIQQVAIDAFGNALGESLVVHSTDDSSQARVYESDMNEEEWDALERSLGLKKHLRQAGMLVATNNRGRSLVVSDAGGDSGNSSGINWEAALGGGMPIPNASAALTKTASMTPNVYSDYDLGTKEGMQDFLDDISYKRENRWDISVEELSTARTILRAYFGLSGATTSAFKKWDALTEKQINARFGEVVNRYASYNQVSDAAFADAAKKLGVDEAAVRAVAEVESKGLGFVAKGKPTILFERHRFSLNTGGVFDAANSEISNPDAGGYGTAGLPQYLKLDAASKLDARAALMSASWGQFQIMGENYRQAGFTSVEDFVTANKVDAGKQLEIFTTFIQNNARLLGAMKGQDWTTFARIYNGKGYAKNSYDTKLQSAYEKYSK